MASRTLPGFGLQSEWALGEDGWKAGMDANLLKLSTFTNTVIEGMVEALPSSPVDGRFYVVIGGVNANAIALRDQGAWVFFDAREGHTVWDKTTGRIRQFNGAEWIDPFDGLDAATAAALAAATLATEKADAAIDAANEASAHATGTIDYPNLAGNTASMAKAVNDGTYNPQVGDTRRVKMYAGGQTVRPFTVVCTAIGQTSVPLPGAWQVDGTFAILGARFKPVVDAYQPSSPKNLKPALVEIFQTMTFGRGMLAAETINIATEQAVVGSTAAKDADLSVTDATNFLLGATVAVLHDNGKYASYFIRGKTGNNLRLRPALKWPVSAAGGGRIERLWYNRAHVGKFGARIIAQMLADALNWQVEVPENGRLFYTTFANNANPGNDQLVTALGATVTYYPAANVNSNGISYPIEMINAQNAFINFNASSESVSTINFPVGDAASAILKISISTRVTNARIVIRVLDNNNQTCLEYELPGGEEEVRPPTIYTLPFRIQGNATSARVQILGLDVPTPGTAVLVNEIDVYASPLDAAPLLMNDSKRPVIVVAGDSWAAGDLASTPEREPITHHLAKLLPWATVINGGVGGRKIWELNGEAFYNAITVHNPDYVVVNDGNTNEAYSPPSGDMDASAVFVAADVQRCISDIQWIGAKPIFIGGAGLAEVDSEGSFTNWTLNDRARKFISKIKENMSRVAPSSGPSVEIVSPTHLITRFPDGRLEVIREAPVNLASGSEQLISLGATFHASYPAIAHPPSLKTVGSSSSYAAAGSIATRMVAGGNQLALWVTGTLGSVTNETMTFKVEGRWKAP